MLSFRKIALFLCLGICSFSSGFAQLVHEVKEGETLYRISKQYGVSVAMILENNRGVTAETIHVGDKLSIPSFQSSSVPTKEHKVKRGETLYGISREYGIRVDQLAEYNPQILTPGFKLKRGMRLRIPDAKTLTKEEVAIKQNQQQMKEEAVKEQVSKQLAQEQNTCRLAVVLPFKSQKGEGERSIEFYRGLLLSTEHFKQAGANIEVYAYDEGQANSDLGNVLAEIGKHKVDFLVAPVYFSHFQSMADFSRKHDMPVIVPFSSKVSIIDKSPGLYLLNTPEHNEAEEVQTLLSAHVGQARYIFLNYLRGNKSGFTTALQERIKKQKGEVVNIEFPEATEVVMEHLSKDKENIIIPNTSDSEVLRTMLALCDDLQNTQPQTKLSLLGYPDWADYLKNSPIERLGKSIYFYTNAYYNSFSPETIDFESTYRKWFKKELILTTPRMALLGYDCGSHFIAEVLTNKNAEISSLTSTPLQSNFKFKATNEKGGRVNTGVWLMRYLHDGSLVKCSY